MLNFAQGRQLAKISLNLSNFNIKNVIDMSGMFYGCSSLKKLIIINFNINFETNIDNMFFGSSDELKNKIKEQNKSINIE